MVSVNEIATAAEQRLTDLAKELGITPTQAGFDSRPHLAFKVSWVASLGFGFVGLDTDDTEGHLLGRTEFAAARSIRRIALRAALRRFRAYDELSERWGPERGSAHEARLDAEQAERRAKSDTLHHWVVAAQDPESEGRTLNADTCDSIWPPHGRSCGAVRWPSE